MTLIYRGRIEEPKTVEVMFTPDFEKGFIAEKELQYGYKLYNSGYNLIDVLDTSSCPLMN